MCININWLILFIMSQYFCTAGASIILVCLGIFSAKIVPAGVQNIVTKGTDEKFYYYDINRFLWTFSRGYFTGRYKVSVLKFIFIFLFDKWRCYVLVVLINIGTTQICRQWIYCNQIGAFYTALKINQAVKGINIEVQKSLLNHLLLVLKSECLDQIYVLRLDLFTNCDQTIIFLIGLIRAQKSICYPARIKCKVKMCLIFFDWIISCHALPRSLIGNQQELCHYHLSLNK